MKQILVITLLIVSLPITVPLTLVMFWVRCALNASSKMMDVLDDTEIESESEPAYIVEAIEDFKKKSRDKLAKEDWHVKGKVKMKE